MFFIGMAHLRISQCLKIANSTTLSRVGSLCQLCNRTYSLASVVPTHIASQVICKRIPLSSRNLLRSYSSEVLVPFAHRHEVLKDVNEEIKMDIGRVFAVVLIGGSQFKVTAEDLIQFVGHVEADVGERIRLEKVLLVGGDNFSVIGKPLLSSDMVRIEATVVEKTLSEKKILFRFKRRMNYKRYKGDEIL